MKKKLLAMGLLACCAALVLALAGCGDNSTPKENEQEPVDAVVTYPNDPFYALIVGNDTRVGTKDEGKGGHGSDGHQRSDTMMLMRVDPTDFKVTVVSIPRDTQTELDGETVKINEAYDRGGIEGSVAKVEELTGLDIEYYFDVSFAEFEQLVDKLGGVDVNVPIPISFKDIVSGKRISLDAGDQHLDGAEALVLARVRKAYINMESTRQFNDRNILISLMQKAIDNPAELAAYTSDFMSIVHTNLPADALTFYLQEFIENSDKVSFLSGSFPAEGDIEYETQLWMAYFDPEVWASMVETVNAGGDPNEVYEIPPIE